MSLRVFFLIGAFLTGVAVILTDLIIGEITQQELLMKISAVIVFSCFAFYIPTLFRIIKKSGENSKKKKRIKIFKENFCYVWEHKACRLYAGGKCYV